MNNIKEVLKRRENLNTIFSVFSEGNTVSKEGVFGSFDTETEKLETFDRLKEWKEKTGKTFLTVSFEFDEESGPISWNKLRNSLFNISKKRLEDCRKAGRLVESFKLEGLALKVVVNINFLIKDLLIVLTDSEVEALISELTSDIALLENSLGFEREVA